MRSDSLVVGIVRIEGGYTVNAVCRLFWSRIFSCEFCAVSLGEDVQGVNGRQDRRCKLYLFLWNSDIPYSLI